MLFDFIAFIGFERFCYFVAMLEFDETVELEDAIAYAGVSKFPARVKCASIAWKAFEGTLESE